MNLDDLIGNLGHRTVLRHIIAGEFASNRINFHNEQRAHAVLFEKYLPLVEDLCPGFKLPYLNDNYGIEIRRLADAMVEALEE